MINKNIFIILLLLLEITSCSPTIKDFDKYKIQPLERGKYLPSKKALKKEKIHIAIVDFDTNSSATASVLNLNRSILSELENILVKNRNIQIVDKKISNKLKEYIDNGDIKQIPNNILGNISIDYIITGSFDKAEVSRRYVSKLAGNVLTGILINTGNCDSPSCETGRTIGNVMNVADAVINPGYWVYDGEVAGNIKIYNASSLLLVDSIKFEGNSEMVEDIGLLSNKNGNENIPMVIKQAFDNSILRLKNRLYNAFLYNGYILEKRVYGNKSIFRINLGLKENLAMGDKFKVYSIINNYNPITDENTPEEIEIGSGVVSNIILNDSAWVILDDKETIEKIKLGDMVRIRKQDK